MAYPSASAPPMPALPTTIIGPQYCASTSPLDLTFVRKLRSMSDGNFSVIDVNGNIIFKVKNFGLNHILVDAAGNPITTLRRKIATMHNRWKAYRGESTDSKDLIFILKRSSLIQFKTTLDVFLASNKNEDVCDFKVKCRWLEESCTVYAGESNNIVAQMDKQGTFKSLKNGFLNNKEQFILTVYPNVDYAFIVALILILEEIKTQKNWGF
ncbi:hypothetical protein P8452_75198 [Trifolium repens]|nr:hypothetical protein P8452_75198 [Trifolium repens]